MLFHTHLSVWVGLVALLMATVCHSQVNRCFPEERPERPSPTFSRGVEDFGLDIFKQLVKATPSSIFVSPYSLWSVLTLAYFGSEGMTRQQLEQALNLQSKSGTFTNWNALKFVLQSNPKSKSGATFKSTNRAYFSEAIVLQRCLSNILFDLRKVDFSNGDVAKNIINHDVNRTTEGKIENFIDFLPPQTRFALINAVYFKGLWKIPFNPTQTRPQEFLIPPGKSAGIVQMMNQEGLFRHGIAPSLEATLLELPYENSETSMFLILPDVWETDRVVELLSRETFVQGVAQMTMKKVDVGLPRFKMTTKLQDELKSTLYSLGIRDLFEPGVANLTAFAKFVSLHADTAIHEALVEINEEGTVAAAASGILNTRFGPSTKTTFMCNRPFLFLITNKITGITLFAGKFAHPADTEGL